MQVPDEAEKKARIAQAALRKKEEEEMAECTFQPKLQTTPAFIKRIARSLAHARDGKYLGAAGAAGAATTAAKGGREGGREGRGGGWSGGEELRWEYPSSFPASF
ncbi:hypothetical protein VYU27_002750 [Nannochloropsis oceanica]